MPRAFIAFEIEITDAPAYEQYRARAHGLLEQFGGVIVAGGTNPRSLEGGWTPASFFLVEFPSEDEALAFYFSEEYQRALPLRLASSRSKAILLRPAT